MLSSLSSRVSGKASQGSQISGSSTNIEEVMTGSYV